MTQKGKVFNVNRHGSILRRREVVVQFWLKSGEVVATLGAGEEREVELISSQLKRFL